MKLKTLMQSVGFALTTNPLSQSGKVKIAIRAPEYYAGTTTVLSVVTTGTVFGVNALVNRGRFYEAAAVAATVLAADAAIIWKISKVVKAHDVAFGGFTVTPAKQTANESAATAAPTHQQHQVDTQPLQP